MTRKVNLHPALCTQNPFLMGDIRNLIDSHKRGYLRAGKELYKPVQKPDYIPQNVIENQIPIVRNNLTTIQVQSVGKLQEAVPRLRVINSRGQTIGSGSAFAISPNGLYLTAMHNTESSIVASEFNSVSPFGEFLKMPDLKLVIDIPHIVDSNDTENGIVLEELPVTLLDYNPVIDVALLTVDQSKLKQASVQHLKLAPVPQRRGITTYKIGHFQGKEFSSLSSGKVVNVSSCYNPIIVTNSLGRGDSGSILINQSGEVIGIPIFVSYPEIDDYMTRWDYVGPTPDNDEYYADLESNCYAGCANVSGSVLPYLEQILGNRNFNNLIDGEEVNVSVTEIQKSRTKSPKFVLVLIELPPVESKKEP